MNYKRVIAVVFLYGILGCINSQQDVPSPDDVLQKISENTNISELKNFNVSAIPGTEEKSPSLKKCVNNFASALEPCLDEKEREGKRIVQNITDSLLAFACYKEGDRIALFISSGGPECFQSQQQMIQDCANNTMNGYIPTPDPNSGDLTSLQSLPSLSFGPKECNDIAGLQTCIVKELEKCQDPTPANVVDSIFSFIMKATPCEAHIQSQGTKDSHSSGVTMLSSLLLTVTAIVLLKFA
ncbi:hypothetical protein KM043_001435 [Ampulex compressa]|nr:hypothetical protein KM043_001435 [Ampulex compressa]